MVQSCLGAVGRVVGQSMGVAERRVLVVGSQCAVMPVLGFLPGVAEDLYRVLSDPRLGGCRPALEGGGLLLDPSRGEVLDGLDTAFVTADEAGATLLVALLGHGVAVEDDFYFLPRDGSGRGRSEVDVYLSQVLKERFRDHRRLDGLIVLLDTCHAGVAAWEAAVRWGGLGLGRGLRRYELLTASADQPAYDGDFTRAVVELLRQGVGTAGETIDSNDIAEPVLRRCGAQRPQRLTHDGGGWRQPGDPGLFLAYNTAWVVRADRVPPAASPAAGVAYQVTVAFEPSGRLGELVARATTERSLLVVGPSGSGKSAMVTALARSDLAPGVVPDRFVHAVIFLDRGTTVMSLAYELRDQLRVTLPHFRPAVEAYREAVSSGDVSGWNPLVQEVFGPLGMLPGSAGQVRLVIDGLDQLSEFAADDIRSALQALVQDTRLAHVRLVLTGRPGEPAPAGMSVLRLGNATPAELQRYLEGRKVPPGLSQSVALSCSRGDGGGWLLARLFADTHSTMSEAEQDELTRLLYHGGEQAGVLAALYDRLLADLGATDPELWPQLRSVLAPLGAAGAGPVLPIGLLTHASAVFGGPDTAAGVRDVLSRLDRLAVRDHPGSDRELVGLFHATFAEHLAAHAQPPVDVLNAHRTLLAAIEELAPVTDLYTDHPYYRYASTDAEAEHLWQLGQLSAAIRSLQHRPRPTPRQNLDRWQGWHHRLVTHPDRGPNHPDTLFVRAEIAAWTGETGKPAKALRLYQELLPDMQRVLGSHHPSTLTTRREIAAWTGETGKPAEALRLYQELLPDMQRVFGPDDVDTLSVGGSIAHWTGRAGNPGEALRLFRDLLPDRERVLGPDHPITLAGRHNIAHWTGRSCEPAEALRLFRELLPDQRRVLGPNHPDTLATRLNIATWTGEIGQPGDALRLLRELLPDMQQVFGPDHPTTRATRNEIAYWSARIGSKRLGLE